MTDEHPPDRLSDLVAAYLAERCTIILDATEQLRAHEPVVHSTRVAVRRLRSTIRVFAELFDVPKAGHLEDELVWWAGLLGKVRDLDIMTKRLDAAIEALPPELVVGPVKVALDREIGAQYREGWTGLVEALDGDRYRDLVETVHSWRSDPPLTEAADVAVDNVKGYVAKANRKVEKRLAAARAAYAEGDPQAPALVHRARKAGKRHRYAVELAEPIWGKKAAKVVKRRKKMQDLLGDHQDAVVCAAFLRDFGVSAGARRGHNGFTYGLLYAAQQQELERMPKRLEKLAT